MNRLGRVIDPGLADMIFQGDAFPSLVTILQDTDTQESSGQERRTFAPFTGHVDLKCRLAPTIEVRPQTQERVSGDMIRSTQDLKVMIKGYFPDITDKMQAQVDGTVYEITAVEWDGNHVYTRLRLNRPDPFNA